MSLVTLDEELDVPFTFEQRPRALPCYMRPGWRLHVLVMILNQCRGGRASLEQLHVLNWAIRTEDTRRSFLQFLQGKRAPNQVIVRYDPSLSRAIDFAFAEELVSRERTQGRLLDSSDARTKTPPYRIALAGRGRTLLRRIESMDAVLVTEKAFLQAIGSKLTLSHVESLFTWIPMA